MYIKLFLLLTLWTYSVLAYRQYCNKRNALARRPTYDFSVKMLQRITEDTNGHFVYSPISTWLQLIALAEGAEGYTLKEIKKVTKHHTQKCLKHQLSLIIKELDKDLQDERKKKIVMAMDMLMAVKKDYVQKIQKLYGIKVLLLDFNDPAKSFRAINDVINEGTGGVINQVVYYDDFFSSVLVMSDANYFKSAWKSPFNSAYTKVQPFYARKHDVDIEIGKVSMMNQIGYFNVTECPHLDARVLEIPCATSRISMLVFLPTSGDWIGELFYSLQRTRLTSVFNKYKREGLKLVNVTLPKFKQQSEIDNLAELIYDMGIKRIFNPDLADLKGISNYTMSASLVTQVSEIEVNEEGVTANASADFLIENNKSSIEFNVNRPFAYMIVDRNTDIILFAGVYSVPSVI